MKDRLVKKNLKGFDYRIRKLGVSGVLLMVVSLSITLPIHQNLAKQNRLMMAEIQNIEEMRPASSGLKAKDFLKSILLIF